MRQNAFGFELINLPVNGFFGQGWKLFLDKRKQVLVRNCGISFKTSI
jgi:hypothetical protein